MEATFEERLKEALKQAKQELWEEEIPVGKRLLFQMAIQRLHRSLPKFWNKDVSEVLEVLEKHPRTKAALERATTNELAFTIRELRF